MNCRIVLAVAAAFGLALPALAQDAAKPPSRSTKKPETAPAAQPATPPKPTKAPEPAAQPANPEMDPAQLEWMKASAPGDNHKVLTGMIGTWSAASKFWMDPGAPPMESTGVVTNTWQLGNRWVRMEFSGEVMKMPFSGIGYFGYDNVGKEYNATWMDTMSTGLVHTKGQYDAAKKAFTMEGEFKEPGGQVVKERDVTTFVDDKTMRFEMFHTDVQGKEHKVGEITYIRAKALDNIPAKPAAKAPDKK